MMKHKTQILDVLTVLVGISALTLAGMTIKDRIAPARERPQVVKDWENCAVGPAYGSSIPKVTLIQFSDFQCPACRKLNLALSGMVFEPDNDIRVIYRNLPIARIHPYAREAALAAECADQQGRFAAYHDLLFEHQDSLKSGRLEAWADEAGVEDLAAFRSCIQSSTRALARLKADSIAAVKLGIRSTPTMLINGRVLVGAPDAESLRAILDSARTEEN